MVKAVKGREREVSLSLIDRPAGGIRLDIHEEAIGELSRNIDQIGLLQAILVRPVGERFEIVAGDRRFLAVKILGWKKIRANVREISDVDCAIARASENLRRVDLTPIEEAAVYQDLVEKHNLSHDAIGKLMGKSSGIVKRRLDLLKMPVALQEAVHQGTISYGVAEEFDRLKDPGRIDYYLGYAVEHGITVAVARSWVKEELDRVRRGQGDVGGGGGEGSPLQSAPIYISCELCFGAMELGKEKLLRICPGCVGLVIGAVSARGSEGGGG